MAGGSDRRRVGLNREVQDHLCLSIGGLASLPCENQSAPSAPEDQRSKGEKSGRDSPWSADRIGVVGDWVGTQNRLCNYPGWRFKVQFSRDQKTAILYQVTTYEKYRFDQGQTLVHSDPILYPSLPGTDPGNLLQKPGTDPGLSGKLIKRSL